MTEEERFMKEAIRQAKKPGFEGGSHRMRDRVRGERSLPEGTTGEIQIKILFPMRS